MSGPLASYFRELSELALDMDATDEGGGALELDEAVAKAVEMLSAARAASHKALLVGNGGSAAIASHMHNDLCKAAGLRAVVLTEAPLLTALANDEGYEHAFGHLAELWAERGDVVIAISSSGRSENILKAVKICRAAGCSAITLSGFDTDNPLRGLGQLNFHVASHSYGLVEVVHSALAHYLSDCCCTGRS